MTSSMRRPNCGCVIVLLVSLAESSTKSPSSEACLAASRSAIAICSSDGLSSPESGSKSFQIKLARPMAHLATFRHFFATNAVEIDCPWGERSSQNQSRNLCFSFPGSSSAASDSSQSLLKAFSHELLPKPGSSPSALAKSEAAALGIGMIGNVKKSSKHCGSTGSQHNSNANGRTCKTGCARVCSEAPIVGRLIRCKQISSRTASASSSQ